MLNMNLFDQILCGCVGYGQNLELLLSVMIICDRSCNTLRCQSHFSDTKNMFHAQTPEDLWALHSQPVQAKPHRRDSVAWTAIKKVLYGIYSIIVSFISRSFQVNYFNA